LPHKPTSITYFSVSTLKTTVNDASVVSFIQSVEDEVKREDGMKLLEMFTRITGEQPKMWGTSMIGFGQYHYKSERSKQEGEWLLTGFSPRKANLTIYIIPGFDDYGDLLAKLGKHKTSTGSCLHINKLADVDMKVLEELVGRAYGDMKKKHSTS
jgi:hypothetical protein